MTVIRCHGRSFHASPHRRTEEGIQGLWDLVITSVSTWLKHLRKYGLLESVDGNGTVNLCTKCTNLTITKPYLNSAKMNLNFTSLNLSSATLNLSFRFSNLSFTLPILSFKVLPVLFPASVYAHMSRARIYIMCSLPCPPTPSLKHMFYNMLINQRVTKLF